MFVDGGVVGYLDISRGEGRNGIQTRELDADEDIPSKVVKPPIPSNPSYDPHIQPCENDWGGWDGGG